MPPKWPKTHFPSTSSPNLAPKQVFHAKVRERIRLKSTGGERVAVQAGRVIRPTGRKDRHSKICTAKGPRDRRLRLSAPTAIQFYDVQDRLRCDRPSEAIDWLMKEAKSAIDALDSADQNTEQEQWRADYFPNSGYGHGNQSPVPLNEEQHINSLSFFSPSFSSGFRSLPNERNPTEFHHHFGAISPSEPPINWPQTAEIVNSQRMISWSSSSISNSLHNIVGQDQSFSQGGTLQSSYSPSFLGLINPPVSNLNYDQIPEVGPSSGTGNSFTGDGFPVYFVPPGIQGGEEKHKLVPKKPSSSPCLLHYQDQ